MEITNQNLEEMLAMVICVVIPVVVRIPLLASLGRFSHLGTIYLHKIKNFAFYSFFVSYDLSNFLQFSPFNNLI
jgi:hypothetical protein